MTLRATIKKEAEFHIIIIREIYSILLLFDMTASFFLKVICKEKKEVN